MTPAAPDTPPVCRDAAATDTPQEVQETAHAVAQELDRILVETVAKIFQMEQVEENEPLLQHNHPRGIMRRKLQRQRQQRR